jgi:flavin-dependent dehydrogenase
MKVVIIGASTSGLFTAYLLAKEGVEVQVYERMNALGLPPRTLIVTNKLNEILDFVPKDAIINKVKYLELFSKSRSAKLELDCPDLIIERKKLVELFARLAQGAGAKIVLRHQFEGFAQLGKEIVVNLKNLETNEQRRLSADILVGADGPLSRVARFASCDGHHLSALLQARVALPNNANHDTFQVWFDSNHTEYFYWLIPESDQVAAVGLISNDPHKAEGGLLTFLRERGFKPLEFQAAMVPMHRFELTGSLMPAGQNVFLVGDSAAQVKVTTVGGVVTGLHAARTLAHAILNGRNYSKELRELKLELNLHLLVRNMLNLFNDADYDELISMLNGRLKTCLEKWTRDELKQSFLRMIWTEPRLITLGAKAFLRSMLWTSNNRQ